MSKDKIYIDSVNVANCEYLDEMFSGMHFCKAKGNMFFCADWDGCPYKQLQAKKEIIECIQEDIYAIKQRVDKLNKDMNEVIKVIEDKIE